MCIYKIFYSAEQLVNFFVSADGYTNEFIYSRLIKISDKNILPL